MALPTVSIQAAFGAGAKTADSSLTWTELVPDGAVSFTSRRGRPYELADTQPGNLTVMLDNRDGRYDPPGPAGTAYAGKVLLFTPIRVRVTWQSVTYDVWRGFVERWPLEYDASGARAWTPLVATDALGLYSQVILKSAVYYEIAGLDPYWLLGQWPCNDPAGLTSAAPDPSGTVGPLTGSGLTFGSPLGSSTGVTGGYAYVPKNATPNYLLYNGGPKYVYQSNVWTAGVTFQAKSPPASLASLLFVALIHPRPGAAPNAWQLNVAMNTDGTVSFGGTSAASYADGKPHTLVLRYTQGSSLVCELDGNVLYSSSSPADYPAPDTIRVGDPVSTAVSGDVFVIDNDVSPGTDLISSVLGWPGDTTGGRFARLCSYAGIYPYTAPGGGSVLAGADYTGQTLLAAVHQVSLDENGRLSSAASGGAKLALRSDGYDLPVSSTLGEGSGEQHYLAAAYDYDPTYLYTAVTVQRAGRSDITVMSGQDGQYGTRNLTRTMTLSDDLVAADAASYLLAGHAKPTQRIREVTLRPSSDPSLWAAALSLDLGAKVTVNRRAAGAPTKTGQFIVEQITHQADAHTGVWDTRLALSPADTTSYWKLDDATFSVLGTTTTLTY